jgi:hypothetical protein
MLKIIRHVILFFVVLLNSVILGEVVFVNRTCNSYNSTPMFNFELNKLVGKWYEIAKYGKPEKCTTDYIKYDPHLRHLNVTHHTGPYNYGHNTTIIIEQRFNYGMDLEIIEHGASSFPAKILTTNYYDNPVIWSCRDLLNGSQSVQKLVILSKYNDVKLNNLGTVIQVLNNTGISKDNIALNMVDHSSNSCNSTSNNKNTTHYGNSTHVHSSGGKVTTILNVPVIPLLFVSILFKNLCKYE